MAPINASTINVADFQAKAAQAVRAGGALDINKQGGLVVRGTSFFGRAALWLRDHLTPDAGRAQNLKVLSALEKSVDSAYGVNSRTYIDNNVSLDSGKRGADAGRRFTGSRDITKQVTHVLDAYKRASATGSAAREQVENYKEHITGSFHASEHERGGLLTAAGRNEAQFQEHKPELEEKFVQFSLFLARNPQTANLVSDKIPGAREGSSFAPGEARAVKVHSATGKAPKIGTRHTTPSAQKSGTKEIHADVLRAAFISVAKSEIPAPGRDTHRDAAPADLPAHNVQTWVDRQYANFAASVS